MNMIKLFIVMLIVVACGKGVDNIDAEAPVIVTAGIPSPTPSVTPTPTSSDVPPPAVCEIVKVKSGKYIVKGKKCHVVVKADDVDSN